LLRLSGTDILLDVTYCFLHPLHSTLYANNIQRNSCTTEAAILRLNFSSPSYPVMPVYPSQLSTTSLTTSCAVTDSVNPEIIDGCLSLFVLYMVEAVLPWTFKA
jgi:hypothetical protein